MLLACLAFTSCTGKDSSAFSDTASKAAAATGFPAQAEPDRANPKLNTVDLRIGIATMKAEIARTERERERGLMFRKSLKDGYGMLFVFESDQRLAFWMKNTTIPLSVAYIAADGTIREIRDLEPLSLAPVQAERSVRYALEAPRGWFARAGIRVGDRMEIPRLD